MNSIINALTEENGSSPFFLVVRGKGNKFRKPNTDILNIIFSLLNVNKGQKIEEIGLDIPESTFRKGMICGDAISKEDPYPPYRWSSVDFDFFTNVSKNYKFEFERPEDIFGHNKDEVIEEVNEDLIILVGNQGSGKFTFAKELAEKRGYVHLEKDVLKTRITKQCKDNLKAGNKVIIDATNPSIKARKEWLDIANSFSASVGIVWSIIPGQPFNELRENKVPPIAYNIYSKNFEEPTENEATIHKLY